MMTAMKIHHASKSMKTLTLLRGQQSSTNFLQRTYSIASIVSEDEEENIQVVRESEMNESGKALPMGDDDCIVSVTDEEDIKYNDDEYAPLELDQADEDELLSLFSSLPDDSFFTQEIDGENKQVQVGKEVENFGPTIKRRLTTESVFGNDDDDIAAYQESKRRRYDIE